MDTYEKKYNEALERARNLMEQVRNNELLGFPDQFTEIFPELRESEDEKIRKWLVDYFSSIKETVWIHRDITCGQILSYLEKQKEQKLTDKIEPKFNIGDTLVNKKNGEKCTISNRCLLHQYYLDTNHCHEIKFDEQDDWELVEQKEQKPNFSEKDSTDFEIEVHEIIAQARNDSRLNDADVLKQFEEEAAFALMLKANKLIEHKPAEWSEEDENRLNAVVELLENTSAIHPNYSRRKLIIWLKSLRPQPKQEWSEEDETILDSVIHIITQYDDLAHEPTFAGPKWTHPYTKEIAWLKSLRPSWKPSEEQMKALKWWSELPSCSPGLKSLYEDLKKL